MFSSLDGLGFGSHLILFHLCADWEKAVARTTNPLARRIGSTSPHNLPKWKFYSQIMNRRAGQMRSKNKIQRFSHSFCGWIAFRHEWVTWLNRLELQTAKVYSGWRFTSLRETINFWNTRKHYFYDSRVSRYLFQMKKLCSHVGNEI